MEPPPPPLPISARLVIHPSVHPSECVGQRRGVGGGRGWLTPKPYYFQIDLNVSDIRATITGGSGSSWPAPPSLCCLCRAMLGTIRKMCFLLSHHQACELDEEHLAACVLRPACLLESLHTQKNHQCVSDHQLQAVSPPHCRVINLIHHHFAKITVFQQRASSCLLMVIVCGFLLCDLAEIGACLCLLN